MVFDLTFLHNLLRLVKGTTKLTHAKNDFNKCDLTTILFNSPIIMIGPSGLLLGVFHLFIVPILILWVGLEINK